MPDPIYGSGALMGSHGLHSIDRTFRRMWLDPRRAIVINIVINIITIVIIITIISHKVKYDRPGECSPEKDCLR